MNEAHFNQIRHSPHFAVRLLKLKINEISRFVAN